MTRAKKRVVVVGAGMSGLTAGAYVLRGGHELLILEKSPDCGGLVHSFRKDGFLFDTGPRAIGNAGILAPLLADLGLDLPMVKGEVSTGIGDRIVHWDSSAAIAAYLESLCQLFPGREREIGRIGRRIRRSMKMAGRLNRVPNPFFKDVLRDPGFFFTKFLPLMPGFLAAMLSTAVADQAMEAVLARLSADAALNDMVTQHYFKGTPASFALGFFENFQDYLYPLGGTGQLPAALEGLIRQAGGRIQTDTEIVQVFPAAKRLVDQRGAEYPYDQLLWAGDLKTLYQRTVTAGLDAKVQRSFGREQGKYLAAGTGESVFTLFLAVNETPGYFAGISRGHFIYTPQQEGLGELHRGELDRIKANFAALPKAEIFQWLREFCRLNSYEISIPVLKDPSLAPPRQTGLVVSLLFDGELFGLVREAGWYEEFRQMAVECMLDALEMSVFPGLRGKLLFREIATPLTLRDRFNVTHGAITGWSMEARPPVARNLTGIAGTPRTALPGVFKAGQWSYSPAGVPVAILTGRIAAGAILAAVSSAR